MKKVIDFGKVVPSNLASADKMLTLFVTQTDEMIEELKGIPAFKKRFIHPECRCPLIYIL